MWKHLDRYSLRRHAEFEHRYQIEQVAAAVLSEKPYEVMPPPDIDPLRWRAMITSYKNALERGDGSQIR